MYLLLVLEIDCYYKIKLNRLLRKLMINFGFLKYFFVNFVLVYRCFEFYKKRIFLGAL